LSYLAETQTNKNRQKHYPLGGGNYYQTLVEFVILQNTETLTLKEKKTGSLKFLRCLCCEESILGVSLGKRQVI